MSGYRFNLILWVLLLFLSSPVFAEELPSLPLEQWGAPAVTVTYMEGKWVISGKRHKVTLNQTDLSMTVHAGPIDWKMVSSSADDMLVKSKGEQFHLRLADAGRIDITPYDTGYKTGVKIRVLTWDVPIQYSSTV